jgi:apolipoprotein N-acyltransferase
MPCESPDGANTQPPTGTRLAPQASLAAKQADAGDVHQHWLIRQLSGLRARIGASRGWSRRGIACAAGSLSVLAMAPFHLWPILLLTLPVVVWLLDEPASPLRPVRSAALDGWWFGFGYFFFGLFWIGEAFLVEAHIFGWLLPFAVTLMPAGLALFTAATLALARALWRPGLSRLLILAICFGLGEFTRGHIFTGFPWNVLGYALTGDQVIMQSAALFGIYGLTLWTVLICATPLVVLAAKGASSRTLRSVLLPIGVLSLAPLAGLYAYGLAVLPAEPLAMVDGVKIRIVQPSVPQHHKWAREKQSEIFNDHLALSRQDGSGVKDDLSGITHLVWPEAAMPFLPLATPQALIAISDLLPETTHLISGALRLERSTPGDEVRPGVQPKSKVFNSILVFAHDGGLTTLYDKVHLVPFGEYLPFKDTLDWLGLEALTRIRGGFSVGPSPRPLLTIPGLPAVGPLICYEAIFPAAVVQGSDRPGLLINATNDGWFGNTTGPYQHFHQSRIRSVEEGVPLVRAANNGISAMIDPYGRVIRSIGLNARGIIDSSLPMSRSRTLYATYGERCFILVLIIFVLVAFATISYSIIFGESGS